MLRSELEETLKTSHHDGKSVEHLDTCIRMMLVNEGYNSELKIKPSLIRRELIIRDLLPILESL